jgi:hypothetical protein
LVVVKRPDPLSPPGGNFAQDRVDDSPLRRAQPLWQGGNGTINGCMRRSLKEQQLGGTEPERIQGGGGEIVRAGQMLRQDLIDHAQLP